MDPLEVVLGEDDLYICIMVQLRKSSPAGALAPLLAPDLFKALGDVNRLTLLSTLAERPEPTSVGDLSSCCPIDLSVVSRHLAILRRAGVLEATRRGRSVLYRARLRHLARKLRSIADALERCCADDAEHPKEKER